MEIIFASNITNSIAGEKAHVMVHKENKHTPEYGDAILDKFNNQIYAVTRVYNDNSVELVPWERDAAVAIQAKIPYLVTRKLKTTPVLQIGKII